MNQKFKKIAAIVSVAAMVTAFAAGCGEKDNDSSTASSTSAAASSVSSISGKEKPFTITMLNQTFGDTPTSDNRIWKAIEAATNTKLDITWVPSASYQERFLAVVASGEMPMTMLVTDDKNSSYVNALKYEAFWEIGPYLKDCPNLSAITSGMWDNAKYNGKNYLVARWRPLARSGILYRKDWADAAGLKEPTNTEELYNMIKTFATGDFDKNGKVDTIGFVLDTNTGKYENDTIAYIASVFGASSAWGADANGKIIPNYAEPEFLDALKWLRKLYSEKLMNQDFAMLPNSKIQFSKGNTGIFGNMSDDIRSPEVSVDLPKNAPGAQIGVLNKLTGPKGVRSAAAGNGYYGGFVIPKSAVKNEADVKKIMAFFDQLAGKDMMNLLQYGEKDTDYTLQGNVASQTADQKNKFVKDLASLGQLQMGVNAGSSKVTYDPANPLDVQVNEMWGETEKTVVLNPVAPFISDTWTSKSADLLKIKGDAIVKFIMGAIDEKGYNDAIKQWYAAGGDKVCEEYTAQYNAAKK